MKHLIQKILQVTSIAVLGFSIFVTSLVNAATGPVLSASSAEATKGSAITITISLDTAGTPVYAYQADLSYSTAFFSSASIAISPGSPFVMDPGDNDPDVAAGGNIHFMRFYTSTRNHNGPVATITLQSNGTVGTTALNFKTICPSTSVTTNCSAVANGSNSQLLTAAISSTIKITEPAAVPSSGASTTAKTSSAAKGSKAVPPAGSAPTTAPQNPESTKTKSSSEEAETFHKITLKILDQDGKPVKNAKVNLSGRSGTTNRDGKITLSGLTKGVSSGTVTYDSQTKPIKVNISSSDNVQTPTVTINIKKSNSLLPIASGIGLLLILSIGFFFISSKGGFTKNKPAQVTITPPMHQPPAPKPLPVIAPVPPQHIDPPKTEVPATKPQEVLKEEAKSQPGEISLHEKAVDPGTIFTPSQSRF